MHRGWVRVGGGAFLLVAFVAHSNAPSLVQAVPSAERCERLLHQLADHLSDMDAADRKAFVTQARQDPGFAAKLEDRLTAAGVLDAPEPLFARLVEKANKQPEGALSMETALGLVKDSMPSLLDSQRELLARVLVETGSLPRPFTVAGLRGRLVDRVQTEILETVSVAEAEAEASKTPGVKDSSSEESGETSSAFLGRLTEDCLNAREFAAFLLAAERSSNPGIYKSVMKELAALAETTTSPSSKPVRQGVFQVSPHGKNTARILYGVEDGRVRIISARLDSKSGETAQRNWINDAENTWRTFSNRKRP